ncbi:MAG TPA: hypothetical protein VGD06_10570 [Acidobacteriota bacterium]
MKLPEEIREEFRRHGRAGGRARAARMSPERKKRIAQRAASTRWIRERFGGASFEALGIPGGDIIDTGLADLAAEKATRESLLVSLAAPRLRREGIPVGATLESPDERLYELLARTDPELAHARYGAYLRRVASFADACCYARQDRD